MSAAKLTLTELISNAEPAEERAASDVSLRAGADTFTQAAIGAGEPKRPVELGDHVVGRTGAGTKQVVGLLGRGAVEDDEQPDVLVAGPRAGAFDELLLRDVRPGGATHVLRIDDD